MTTNTPTRRTLHALDVPLAGGRTLRVVLELDEDGTPDALHLAVGWPDAARWPAAGARARGEGLSIPGEHIGALRAALAALVLEAAGGRPLKNVEVGTEP
jgi:hypothetical protein